jgi:hypothetical protein
VTEGAQGIRLGTPPPYADYLRDLTWPDALKACDSFIRQARGWDDQELANGASSLLRYLAWLSSEVHGLLEQMQERGVDFD